MKNFWTRYIEYLKDNPNHYWFKRKLYGWGWVPATKEGWLVTLIFVLLVVAVTFGVEENASGEKVLKELGGPILLLILVFIFISYKKGEKACWSWGFPKEKETKETNETDTP